MKKTKPIAKDDLGYEELVEENGICDFVPTGTPIAQFTFKDNIVPSSEPMLRQQPVEVPIKVSLTSNFDLDLTDNRTLKSEPNGITPPIGGEYFLIKRGFTFRRSTIRLLNELKAAHSNENVYLSTIVDKAICHYHEYVFKEKGSQD